MSALTILSVLLGVLAAAGGAVYLFGIPPWLKRQLEEKALETMGENKMSYMMKDSIGKIPADDQEDVKALKNSLGNAGGGLFQNPLGKETGNALDSTTSGLTGREQ